MPNIPARIERIEALINYRPPCAGPIFIEPCDCADREEFARACRASAGDVPCIVILPENGRETPPFVAEPTLHLQPSRD